MSVSTTFARVVTISCGDDDETKLVLPFDRGNRDGVFTLSIHEDVLKDLASTLKKINVNMEIEENKTLTIR